MNYVKFVGGIIDSQIWDIFESDDEEDIDRDINKRIVLLEKVVKYAEETVPRIAPHQFKVHFRMNAATLEDFVTKMHSLNKSVLTKGQPEVPLRKRILVTIWCLANPECFRSVADRFGIAISTCWRILYLTCDNVLQLNYKYKIISWPTNERAAEISNHFEGKTNMHGIIGCIDGTHIAIKAPKFSHSSYVNRKGFHSLLLQAVCDHDLLFTDCYTGEAGSIHDALLYTRSDLSRAISQGVINFANDSYMIGDAAYPLKEYLMVPFKDNGYLTDRQKNFNIALSKARQTIERAFALLKGRFRRLKFLEAVRQDLAVLLIISACIMHNICLLQGDNIEGDNSDNMHNEQPHDPEVTDIEETPARNAVNKRNNIVNSLPSYRR